MSCQAHFDWPAASHRRPLHLKQAIEEVRATFGGLELSLLSLGSFGELWACLGELGRRFGSLWRPLGAFWGAFGCSGGSLAGPLGSPGVLWVSFRCPLGPQGAPQEARGWLLGCFAVVWGVSWWASGVSRARQKPSSIKRNRASRSMYSHVCSAGTVLSMGSA